jgi:hypothetical protein
MRRRPRGLQPRCAPPRPAWLSPGDPAAHCTPPPPPPPQVEVDLALSAHANARVYYDSRRKHQARLGQLVASEGQPCG